MNHTLDLPGLREDMARDFLASLGLLRLIDLKWPQLLPKLAWSPDRGIAQLYLLEPLPANWCQVLVSDLQSLEADPLSPMFHGEIIKADFQVFRAAIRKALEFGKSNHPLAALPELLFAGYGGQMSDPKTRQIEPTLLSFANGQSGKSLLRDARELIRALDADAVHAALVGEGQPVAGKSFRWTPQEYRPAAHRAHDPGSKVKGDESLDIPYFNVLAFTGLASLPTCDVQDDSLTAAFHRDEPGWSFRWPIWNQPLSVDEVTALLACPVSSLLPDVIRTWKSRRLVAEKSVYFAPATLA
jgi:hypothetical protein